MAFGIDTVTGVRLTYGLGFLNVLLMLLALTGCRCIVGVKAFNDLSKRGWFRWLVEHHCLLWILTFISVTLHAVMVFIIFGKPY